MVVMPARPVGAAVPMPMPIVVIVIMTGVGVAVIVGLSVGVIGHLRPGAGGGRACLAGCRRGVAPCEEGVTVRPAAV